MEREPNQIKNNKKQENSGAVLNEKYILIQNKFDDIGKIEKERELNTEAWRYRSELRKQNQALYQYEGNQISDEKVQKEYKKILEEVLNKEENTEMEVAMEEALKMNEDITELVKEGKAENCEEACALVAEKKEYQLKDKERIEKEESVRPYFILVGRALEKDDLELVQGVIKALPPEKKEIFSAVRDVLDRPFEKKEKQYIREGKEEKLADLMLAQSFVSNQFDVKNLEKIDSKLRRLPVFVNAAKKFLAKKLEEIVNFSSGYEIKEYIWVRNKMISAGITSAEEIDSSPDTQWKLKSILIGKGESSKPFFVEHVERYQYLKSQLEFAGIFKKNEINQDPEIQGAFCSILDRSLDESAVSSDEETFERYMKVRQRMSHYKIMDKKEMDWNAEMQENFYELLLKQFSLNTAGGEKIKKFLNFYSTMVEEEMIPPETMNKWSKDEKLIRKLIDALNEAVSQCPELERGKIYSDLREEIVKLGVATYEIIDGWKVLEDYPGSN